jgi:uncharacterized protein YbaR (Trm112 family)
MAISQELLDILVCPICKATLDVKTDESGLKCVECHRVYPIRDGIPVMLVDEARIEEEGLRGPGSRQSAAGVAGRGTSAPVAGGLRAHHARARNPQARAA